MFSEHARHHSRKSSIVYRAQATSGANLTIRFAQGFPAGLACASLRDARANEHSISAVDRSALEAVVANRNSAQKHVWRAKIVMMTAEGYRTAEIMRATGKAKTVICAESEVLGGLQCRALRGSYGFD